jgi:uncharacterized protein YndB with AHSA1/START domain
VTGSGGAKAEYVAALVVRRLIRAAPETLFDAWTDAGQLVRWWGPAGVVCTDAGLDARPGGAYRIANRLPDGSTLYIGGVFEVVERPSRLVFSWQVEGSRAGTERVTVQFIPNDGETEVIVTHERIADAPTRERHASGWAGCLAGLARYVDEYRARSRLPE